MTNPHDIALIRIQLTISMKSNRNPGQYGTPFQLERLIILKIIHGAKSLFPCKEST